MSPSEIASLIAAGGFVLLVLFLAVPILKLGKLIDRSSDSLVQMTDELTPLVSELTVTLEETNRQLKKFDGISTDVAQVTKSFASMVAIFSAYGVSFLETFSFCFSCSAFYAFNGMKKHIFQIAIFKSIRLMHENFKQYVFDNQVKL